MKNILRLIIMFIVLLSPGKYISPDANAQGWQWGRAATGVGIDSWPVATDASGNVFGAGYVFSGGATNFGGGVTLAPSLSGQQSAWVKYSTTGTPLWAGGTVYGSTYIDNIATDPSGNLIVFGTFSSDSMKIGSFVLRNAYGTSGSSQYYLAKISPTGTVLWAINDGNIRSTYLYDVYGHYIMSVGAVTTDAAGNIYITSSFTKPTMTIGTTTLTNSGSSGTNEVFVAKYTSAGMSVWATSFGGSTDDYGFGITVASTGYVYVSGEYFSASFTIGSSTLSRGIATYPYAYIAKISPIGVPTWGQGEGGTGGAFAVGLAHDNYGNVYMTGGFEDNTITFGDTVISRPMPYPTSNQMSLFLVQYSSANEVTWHKVISGIPSAAHSLATPTWGYAIAMASCGQIWVSGNFIDSISIDTSKLYAPTYSTLRDPVFIAGYNLSGGVVGYSALESGGDDQNGIACDPSGNLYMCSDFYSSINFVTGPDTLHGSGGESFYVAKYANSVAIPDTLHRTRGGGTSGCKLTGVTLHGDPGYANYFWYDSTTDSTHHIDSAGTYYVYNITCGDTTVVDSFHVTLLPPDSSFGRKDSSVCFLEDSATVYGPTGYTGYIWSTGSTSRTLVVHDTGTYILTCLDSTLCLVFTDTFRFNMLYRDTTFFRTDTSICASLGSITLYAPPGYAGYSWSTGSTTSSSTVSNSAPVSVGSSIGVNAYGITGCTIAKDTFNVRFMPVPVVSLGNDTAFCLGQSITLSSPQPAGFGYSWSTGSTAPTIIAGGSAGATVYTLVVTDTDACTTTAMITVTVSPLPVVDLGPDTAICSGSIPMLHSFVTYPAWATYIWNTGATTSSISATTIGTYWLQVTVVGCSGADTMEIKNLFDTLNFPQVDTALCQGQQLAIVVAGTPGMTYQWTPTAGISSSTTASTVILADTSATYTLRASISTCPDLVRSFHLDIQPNPQVYISDNRFVCRYDTLHLEASVTPSWYTHYSYNWSPGGDLDDSTIQNAVYTAGDSGKIVLTVSTPHNCIGKDSIIIHVHASDSAVLNLTVHVCPHDSVRLMPISKDPGTIYRWHPGLYLNDSMASSPWVYPITSQHYVGIAYSQYNCRDTVHAYVLVDASAEIYLGSASTTIYPGESYQIPTQTNCTSFAWFPPSGLNSASISAPIATPQISTKYIVNASTEWGCKITDSIEIDVSTETLLAVPNAFTPGNGSGPNNTFKLDKRGIAKLNYFRIYNRWGNKVYESTDIDAGWDGTYKGVAQSYDVYVYQVEAVTSAGRTFSKSGNVTLIR